MGKYQSTLHVHLYMYISQNSFNIIFTLMISDFPYPSSIYHSYHRMYIIYASMSFVSLSNTNSQAGVSKLQCLASIIFLKEKKLNSLFCHFDIMTIFSL